MEATIEGDGLVQSDPLDEPKEESMPHPSEGKNEDKDDKISISGEDAVQIEGPAREAGTSAKEAGTSDMVLTSIHKLKKYFH